MTQEIFRDSLKKTAKGTAIAFIGLIIFSFLEFVIRVIIARNTSQTDYGIYNIGYVLLTFFIMVAGVGLNSGAPRYIAYFRGICDNKKVDDIIFSSLQLSLFGGIFFFFFFFLFSDFFTALFHLESSPILKIFAVAIPFSVMIEILAAIFIGFGRMHEKVYFRDGLASILKFVAVILAIFLGCTFIEIVTAYVIAIVVATLLFVLYAVKKFSLKRTQDISNVRKELFLFSLPLWTTNILNTIVFYLDTLILGYFTTVETVGLYNAARPITQFLNIFVISLSFIYVPIASQLFAKNNIEEIRKNYVILTKWIFLATIPFFLNTFLFPETIINILFGPAYAQPVVALTLQILAFGVLVNVMFGPNAPTLVVFGRPKLVLIDNFAAGIVYILANLYLVPLYSMIGAALAATLSLCVINVLKSAQIFYYHKIHQVSLNFLKTIILSGLSLLLIYGIAVFYFNNVISVWTLVVLNSIFIAVYFTLMVVTKSFDREEIDFINKLIKIKLNR
jgi:O-antigen/teichoic acid export membrane protein